MSWQPIETAPRDGTRVLLVFPRGRVYVGSYEVSEHHRNGKLFYRREGWWLDSAQFMADDSLPMLWMPLPEVLAMKKMFERVERAISDTADAWVPGEGCDVASVLSPLYCKDLARAAVEAMREPTTQEQRIRAVEAMGEAMQPFSDKLKAEGRTSEAIVLMAACSSHITDRVWRAMIDAILDE